MRYLIQITRQNRAERPSEQQIILDSKNVLTGNFGEISQTVSSDNFFIFSASPASVQFELMRILATMPFTPFGLSADDGFRVIPYQHEINPGLTPREGCSFQVLSTTIDGSRIDIFSTASEAQSFIESLDPSDGYVLIDELETSIVLNCRPSLWVSLEQISIVQSKNLKGRTDKDRI